MNLDFYIFQEINNFAGEYLWLDTIGIFFAKYLEYILIFSLFLFLLKNRKKCWSIVINLLASAILSRLIITEFIRFVWARPRPFIEHQINPALFEKGGVNLLLDQTNAPAFPSGHAAFYFAIATAVFLYNKKVGSLFLIASFLISISRVFCGVHWPLDIIAGASVGIFSGWLINRCRKISCKK